MTLEDGSSTELTICAGDGNPDPFTPILTENLRDTFWVITDVDLNILGLPQGPSFDLEGAGEGVCLLWNLSIFGEITGLEEGLNAGSLDGCFAFSNPITVTRQTGNDCGSGFTGQPEIKLSVIGNPTRDLLRLDVTSQEVDGMSKIVIRNLDGQVLINRQWQITNGQNNIMIPVMELSSGFYIINVQVNGHVKSSKMVKL